MCDPCEVSHTKHAMDHLQMQEFFLIWMYDKGAVEELACYFTAK